jgi:hypothetical protein
MVMYTRAGNRSDAEWLGRQFVQCLAIAHAGDVNIVMLVL